MSGLLPSERFKINPIKYHSMKEQRLSELLVAPLVNGIRQVSGDIRITGNATAARFIGDGSQLTNLPASGDTIQSFVNDTGKLTLTTDKGTLIADLNVPVTTYLSQELISDPDFNLSLTNYTGGTPGQGTGWYKTASWFGNGTGFASISVGGGPQNFLFQEFYAPATGTYEVVVNVNSVSGAGFLILVTDINTGSTPSVTSPGVHKFYFNLNVGLFRFHLLVDQNVTASAEVDSCRVRQVQLGKVYGDDKFVHLSGDETIRGAKSFTGNVTTSSSFIGDGSQLTNIPAFYKDNFFYGRNLFYNAYNAFGGNNNPTEAVDVNGNVKVNGFFIGDGSKLTNLPSSSATLLKRSPEFTASSDGQQSVTLPSAASFIVSISLQEGSGLVRTLYPKNFSVYGTSVTITSAEEIVTGDTFYVTYQ